MTQQEQIAEMWKSIPQTIIAYDMNPKGQHLYGEQREYIAKALYDAGYRKVLFDTENGYGNIKQAQTDVINTIVEYCENPNHWRELKDCKLFGGKSDDLRNFINKIFTED